MHSSKLLWLLAIALLPTASTLATGGGDKPVTTVDGLNLLESRPYQLVFEELTSSFTTLIDKYAAEGLDMGKIGGFTFIPNRFAVGSTGNRHPLVEPDPVIDLPSPIDYCTYGYRVFLTFWEDDNSVPSGRRIRFFGLTDPTDAFRSTPPDNPSGNFFILDKLAPETFSATDDQEFLSSVAEFELSYLPIEDFYYLAESESYYTDEQALAINTADRRLVIQRAVVAQTFDLGTNGIDSIYQYRTLSFRPYPYPELSVNEEAGIAFKYGYYCPPYWGRDGEQSVDNAAEEDAFMLFFQPPPSEEETNSKAKSLLTSLSLMLGGQLTSREATLERFGGDTPDTLVEILTRFWWAVIGLLLLGFFISRATQKEGGIFTSQNE